MNESYLAFDPSLQPVFSEQLCTAALNYRPDSRHLFYTLMHISEHYDVLPLAYQYLKNQIQEGNKHHVGAFFRDYHPEKIDRLVAAGVDFRQSDVSPLSDCLQQCAPLILTEPCWLQAVSQAATCQSSMAIQLMSVYLTLTSDVSYKNLFRALLLETGIELPAIHTRAFTEQKAVSDCFYDFSVIQLALAAFPRVFFPELLGFSLAYCQKPAQTDYLLAVSHAQKNKRLVDFISVRKKRSASQLKNIVTVIQEYLQLFAEHSEVLWQRVQSGFWLYQWHNQHCDRQRQSQSQSQLSPGQVMAKLLQLKASSAFGHHGKIRLEDKSLDDWFAEDPFDAQHFLSALRHSRYVDSGNPAESPLLKLFEFNGPMFGVLNENEKNSVKNWLFARPSKSPERVEPVEVPMISFISPKTVGAEYRSINDDCDNRTLYYYLVNTELFPEVLTAAKKKVHRILRLSKLFSRLPFDRYSHQGFEDYINRLYQNEVNTYEPLKSAPKLGKNAYVWGIEQLAPTILTDGCWLQDANFISAHANSAITDILTTIYIDETGNGLLQQNHPYIYQQLLDSLNIKVPPIHSKAFIEHSGFIDSAFDIPVYLLAISKFSSSLLPELLGLNMAIELSGLGRVYLRLAEELKFWGINPAIVNVHISIDNVGSGHSALAKQAIQYYLDGILASHGQQEMQNHWQRIYAGFCSLQMASTRFKLALVAHYCWNQTRGFMPLLRFHLN